MLLGRIGRHDQALHIYAHKLHDPKKAEEYCKIHYDPEDKDTQDDAATGARVLQAAPLRTPPPHSPSRGVC